MRLVELPGRWTNRRFGLSVETAQRRASRQYSDCCRRGRTGPFYNRRQPPHVARSRKGTSPVCILLHTPHVPYLRATETTGRCGVVGVVVAGEIGISPQLVTDWDRSTIGVVTTVAKVRRPSKLELHEWIWRVDLVDVLRFVLL